MACSCGQKPKPERVISPGTNTLNSKVVEGSVSVTGAWLNSEIPTIKQGMTFDQLVHTFGVQPYQTNFDAQGCGRAYWAFRIKEEVILSLQYEIYEGEFQGGRLVRGSILPNG
jgi:hypothetical protein